MIREIRYKDNLIAIQFSTGLKKKGTAFFTPPENEFQIGILNYPEGRNIKRHYHKKIERRVNVTQELLYVSKGKLEVSLFWSKKLIEKMVLKKGDAILLINGGHSFKIFPKAKIIEVKQGPYMDAQKDKEYF